LQLEDTILSLNENFVIMNFKFLILKKILILILTKAKNNEKMLDYIQEINQTKVRFLSKNL
jgi:hypothetical protein